MKKIAIIRFSAIGDVALWLPVIRRALALNNNLEIVMITKKNTAFLFQNIERLEVIGVDFNNQYKGVFGIYQLATWINNNFKIHAIVDGHDVLRSKIVSFFIKANYKITFDKGRSEKKIYLKNRQNILPHTTQRYTDALSKLGLKLDTNFAYPNIEINTTDKAIAQGWLNKIDSTKIIGIAPFAMHKGKIYDSHKLTIVMKQLNKLGYTLLLFGVSNSDQHIINHWIAEIPTLQLTNTLSFAQEMVVMQACQCVVSMDSANMHLASLQGIPVVSIWGATSPEIGFAPLHHNTDNILQISSADLPCRPCSIYGNIPCTNTVEPYACLNRITPEMIVDKVIQIAK